MCRKFRFITLRRWLSAGLGGLLFASILALFPSPVLAQDCKGGICVYESVRWDAAKKKMVRSFGFRGYPRTPQGYVTDFIRSAAARMSSIKEGNNTRAKAAPLSFPVAVPFLSRHAVELEH